MQIVSQIERMIVVGALRAGQRLPTIKQLAVDLAVNPNTVAHAYRELERSLLIETRVGRGSFVRQMLHQKAAADIAKAALLTALRDAKAIGLSSNEIVVLLQSIFAEALS